MCMFKKKNFASRRTPPNEISSYAHGCSFVQISRMALGKWGPNPKPLWLRHCLLPCIHLTYIDGHTLQDIDLPVIQCVEYCFIGDGMFYRIVN